MKKFIIIFLFFLLPSVCYSSHWTAKKGMEPGLYLALVLVGANWLTQGILVVEGNEQQSSEAFAALLTQDPVTEPSCVILLRFDTAEELWKQVEIPAKYHKTGEELNIFWRYDEEGSFTKAEGTV